MFALKDIKFAIKLPALIAGCAVLFTVVFGIYAFLMNRTSILEAQQDKLVAINDSKAQHLQFYLHSLEEDIAVLAESPATADALESFIEGWATIADNHTLRLQQIYVDKIEARRPIIYYDAAHEFYEPWLAAFLEQKALYDLFLIDEHGNIIYTHAKERDFATNLLTGDWRDTQLAKVFKAANSQTSAAAHFGDFSLYEPSAYTAAAFVAARVHNEQGRAIGVAAFQLPADKVNDIMNVPDGLGRTGEAYLVGGDGLMRSTSRFSKGDVIMKTALDPEAMQTMLSDKSGVMEASNTRGETVLRAFSVQDFLGTSYVMVTDINMEEVFEPIRNMGWNVALNTLAVLLVMTFVGTMAARMVTQPLSAVTETLSKLSDGKTDVSLPHGDRGDEIGQIAAVAAQFQDSLRVNAQMSRRLLWHKQTLEQEIEAQTAELKKLNAELEQSARHTSRKLRAPVAQTIASLDNIEEEIAHGRLEPAGERLSDARKALQSMESIIAAEHL